MSKLVCLYSGWFDIDTTEVMLMDPETGYIKTAQEWLDSKGNIDGLILNSFNEANDQASDGDYTDIHLSIEDGV